MTYPINIDELINGNTIEWDRIELKKGWNPENVIHSLCAYANDINNWDGEYLIIGVAENNGKAGLPPPVYETDEERSYFLCTIKIHPLIRYESSLDHTEMTKDVTIDKDLNIKSLKDVDYYLRSLDDQRWDIEKNKIKGEVKDLFLKVLNFSINPKTREEIFNYIGIFNNSRNFGIYIKPLIDVGWITLTIPDKPTSKNQKYITSEIAKRLIEQKIKGINRIPVESSNIASIGYDAKNKILEIEFNHGAIYQYFDVPKEVYENLINATAIGSYFFHNIKSNYDYSKK